MLTGILGRKIGQSQIFSDKGKRLAVTLIKAGPCFVTQIKNEDKNGYKPIQLGFGSAKEKNTHKPLRGIFKKAGITKTPRFLREVRFSEKENGKLFKLGQKITVDEVFNVGDLVKVSGISKGKGFAGVVKRWGFSGGPKTHGQGDKHRSPGSIGQGTTPGRVFKGKKMAGRMGGQRTTVSGLKVINIDKEQGILVVSGLAPGNRNGLLEINKVDNA